VTKFHQNRSTLKGRSAGQRHTQRQTDRQTNSAENKGPSGLQSGQQCSLTVVYTVVLANVHVRLFAGARPSVVCNVRAPYSGGSNFPQNISTTLGTFAIH